MSSTRGIFPVVLVSVLGAGFALACGACGSSKPSPDTAADEASSAGSHEKKLDCAFLKGDQNCWKIVAAKVSACLGAVHATGKLEADLSVCRLQDEGMVKLGSACDPDKECEVQDVFMGKAGKKCLEFHATVTKPASEMDRGAGHFELAGADGTVKVEYDEKKKSITCPDGMVYSGSGDWKKELAECNDESGFSGMPSYSFTKTATVMENKKTKKAGTGNVSFEISSVDPLFDCSKP